MFGTLNLPTWHVDALNKLKDYDYTSHVFFVTANSLTESMRFCSYYDEPGVVGTFSAIILFFYNRRLPLWAWIVYFVAGVLSFSFFFFGIMILYPITLGDKKMSQRAWRIILGIVIIVALFSLFERSLISQYVFDRFQLTDSGFAGDNRNNDYFRDYFYNTFVNSPELLFGSSNLGQGSFVGGSFSIEVIIYRYGLLFFGYGLLLYVYLLWKYRTSTVNFFATTLVWFLLTYQRPSFSSIYYYIFFTTILPASQLAKRSETGSLQNKGLKEESLVLRTTYKA